MGDRSPNVQKENLMYVFHALYFSMQFLVDGLAKDISKERLSRIIDAFMQFLVVEETIKDVSVFGGCVRDPDKVHGDIDLIVRLDKLPDEVSGRALWKISEEWQKSIALDPEMALIDCFFTDGILVMSFNHKLDFFRLFRTTTVPRNGGLDDDDDEIYIGDILDVKQLKD